MPSSNFPSTGNECFQAGQVKYKISEWEKLTSDKEILQNVKGAKIPFEIQPTVKPKYKFQKFSDQEIEEIDKEIEKLKQKWVIKETHHEDGEFISTIFVTPKKDGSYRLILNLKDLNH